MEVLFKEGHRHERFIIDDLREKGFDILESDPATGDQWTISLPVSSTVVIVGHLDGKVSPDMDVFEAKGFSPDNFKDYEKNGLSGKVSAFGYGEQLTIYMAATGRPALYAVKNKSTGKIITKTISDPPADINTIKARVFLAESYARRGELPACDKNGEFNCPFRYLHDEKETEVVQDEKINALAEAYDRARQKSTEAKSMQDEARSLLKDAIGENEKVESTDYKVSRSQVPRKRLDTEKMTNELGSDVVERYQTVTYHEQIRVTAKRKEELA